MTTRYTPPYFDFEICGVKRKLPFVKIKDDMALASFCIASDTELVQAVAPELIKRLPEVDVLLTAEAKGIILTYEISHLLGMKDFVLARKSNKPYMQNVLEATVYSITTQAKQTLYLDGCDAEKLRGKRVAIIDDVFATGNSLAALEKLATLAGANIVAKAAVLAELDSVYRDDVIFLKEHYVFTPNPDGTFTPIESKKKSAAAPIIE
ncbi:MAG: phosphoribosyltransferase family protein [Peptococcaceae bacterium]|nr:phosphoribosyltransferase family protein [Peptococcaceae bacterium]